MNKVFQMGRLTKDPDIRYSSGANQTAVAKWSLAVDRRFKKEGEPDADFFNCVAFGKLGEFVEKYLHKGTKILVEGRIQNNNYTSQDGTQVRSFQIVAENIEFCESKAASQGQGQNKNTAGSGDNEAFPNDFVGIPDGIDDFPFE